MRGREAAAAMLDDAGLSRVRDRLAPLALPAVRARTEPVSPDALPLGASRFGAEPDLPHGAAWPMSDATKKPGGGRPMEFVAQLRLSEIAAAADEPLGILPGHGILWIFYDTRGGWGLDERDRDSFHIRYEPDEGIELNRAEMPREEVGRMRRWMLGARPATPFPALRVRFEPMVSFPWLTAEIEALGLDESESDALYEFALGGGDGPAHQIGGHAAPVQGDVREECVQANASTRAEDWRLLVQIDSDGAMMWGDAGMIYVMSRGASEQSIGDPWLIMQCH